MLNNPCFNGAKCTDDFTGGYTCTCKDGFTGKNCQYGTSKLIF